MTSSQVFLKRALDILLSIMGLLCVGWFFLLLALLVFFRTGDNGFFKQIRLGKNAKPFHIIKIRTIYSNSYNSSKLASPAGRFAQFVRRAKLDELPQLYNVLIGNMSFVGPRPDVPGFADKLQGKDREILQLRPGITGPASLKFKNEEELLAAQPDPERFNRETIWPEKVRLNLEYLHNWSLGKDIYYIFKTVFVRS